MCGEATLRIMDVKDIESEARKIGAVGATKRGFLVDDIACIPRLDVMSPLSDDM